MPRRIQTLILFLAFMSIVAGADVQADDRTTPNAIHVGVIVALTGEAASLGEAVKNGVEMALSKLPNETRQKIVVTYEDDSLQAKNAVTAFERLRSGGKVDVLINAS